MFSMAPAVQCSKHVENIKDKNYKVCEFFFTNTMIELYTTRDFLVVYQEKLI